MLWDSMMFPWLLRSAVGMTHSLRSDLWWTIPFHALLDHFVRLYSDIDQTYLSIEAQCVSHYYPRWTATLKSYKTLLTNRNLWSRKPHTEPHCKVLFGESLVVRLYSEIDQTYLSIEAQCVSHYYPRWTATLVLHAKWHNTFYFKPLSSNRPYWWWFLCLYIFWRWTHDTPRCLVCYIRLGETHSVVIIRTSWSYGQIIW